MSVGHAHLKYTFSPSGLPNVKDLDESIEQKMKVWEIVLGYQLPYCAGYSEDGTKVYIDDEFVPEFWVHNERRIKVWRGSLFQHETTEKDYLLRYGEKFYFGGHSCGTYAEDTYVRANGGDPIAYEDWWKPIIARCQDRKSFRVPKDLDLAPYHDSTDDATIAKMRFV